MTDTAQERPRSGRPRSARADAAILEATITLLLEGGYANLSIEAVAERAGVGKTTIYRRFPGKPELVIAALEAAGDVPGTAPPDTGSLLGDLQTLLTGVTEANRGDIGRLLAMPRLTSEAATTDPALFEAIRSRLVDPRRELVKGALRAAAERGELTETVDVDLLADALMGTLVFYLLRTGGRDANAAQRPLDVLRMLFPGLAPHQP